MAETITLNLNEWNKKPTKIIFGYPDIVEMTDKDGKIHTYSIIELLDGLKALAQQMKKD